MLWSAVPLVNYGQKLFSKTQPFKSCRRSLLRFVVQIYAEARTKDKQEAFNLMRGRLAEIGADAVIKVRKKKNMNYEGIVVLFD